MFSDYILKKFSIRKYNLQLLESLPCARGGGAQSATEGLAVTFLYLEHVEIYRYDKLKKSQSPCGDGSPKGRSFFMFSANAVATKPTFFLRKIALILTHTAVYVIINARRAVHYEKNS